MTSRPKLEAVPSNLPEPPYPADIKCNGYKPEFDVARIDTSETWTLAEDDERPWLLRVWFEAWRSVPVGSMPANRRLFARRIGCKEAFLNAHAEILLRGWTLHSDGNLYHPVVTDMVLAMLSRRRNTARKVAEYRERKRRERDAVTGNNAAVTGYKGVCNRNVMVGNPSEQEQEQEQEKNRTHATHESAVAVAPTRAAPCPYEEIRKLWSEVLPELQQPIGSEHWTDARKAMLRARWRDQLPDLDAWRQCFELIRQSDFLMGRTHARGRKPFQASLFWVAKPENLLKIYEGKYA